LEILGVCLKKYTYLILFVLLASMLAVGCAEKPLDQNTTKKILDDLKSNVKLDNGTNGVLDNLTGTLTFSANINQTMIDVQGQLKFQQKNTHK
jgi:hypothetical protein